MALVRLKPRLELVDLRGLGQVVETEPQRDYDRYNNQGDKKDTEGRDASAVHHHTPLISLSVAETRLFYAVWIHTPDPNRTASFCGLVHRSRSGSNPRQAADVDAIYTGSP